MPFIVTTELGSIFGMKTGSEFAVWMENRTVEQKYSALSPSRMG